MISEVSRTWHLTMNLLRHPAYLDPLLDSAKPLLKSLRVSLARNPGSPREPPQQYFPNLTHLQYKRPRFGSFHAIRPFIVPTLTVLIPSFDESRCSLVEVLEVIKTLPLLEVLE